MNEEPHRLASAAMYVGAASTALLWGLSINDIAVISSTVIAVLGGAVHVWARMRQDWREQTRHAAEMRKLSDEP